MRDTEWKENDMPNLPFLYRIRIEWVALALFAILAGIALACTLVPVRL